MLHDSFASPTSTNTGCFACFSGARRSSVPRPRWFRFLNASASCTMRSAKQVREWYVLSYEEIRNFPRPITVDEEIKFAELLKVRNFRRRYPMDEVQKASSLHPFSPHLGCDPVIVVAPIICLGADRCERTQATANISSPSLFHGSRLSDRSFFAPADVHQCTVIR